MARPRKEIEAEIKQVTEQAFGCELQFQSAEDNLRGIDEDCQYYDRMLTRLHAELKELDEEGKGGV